MLLPKHCNSLITMKLTFVVWVALSGAALAATEEQLNRHFTVQPGGKVAVDVAFGAITVSTNVSSGVAVDVSRKIGRKNKKAAVGVLNANPLRIARDGDS